MDSDSDSGGSHISSTPPRHPQPPPPSPPSRPPSSLLSSTIFRRNHNKPKTKNPSTTSRPILKPKPKPSAKRTKPSPQIQDPNPNPPPPDTSPDPTPSPSLIPKLPFQIRRSSDQHFPGDNTSVDNLPAGRLYLSKFGSFSNTRRSHSINFEPSEIENGISSPLVPNETLIEVGELKKPLRKHPNLIGSSGFSPEPVKKPKCVNEGNFVRLNINGYGRKKFTYMGRKRNPNAYNSSRSSYKRKRKFTVRKEGGEGENFGEEEGFGLEERESENFGLIEEAVMAVRSELSDENLVKLLKVSHGYDSFRSGQLEAIKSVLGGNSTMVILPTGAGKSLCYQLPAMVLPGITLVISPLVALMIDQLRQLPAAIRGGLLSSSQTLEEMSDTLQLIQEGALKVLFVSPERLLNAEFTSIFSSTQLVSLVVIDEAHCISEWSHNFRPSYMRLRASVLCSMLSVECVLAMTATATTKTLHDVMSALEIPPTNLIQAAQLRDNLQLSVSMSGNRMKDLMALLKSSPYTEVKSIIVYCKYQSDTDMISKFLSDSNIRAKSYHSGIPAKDRRRTQELFCVNKIRVVVATVAFGMGLDKSDIGAVIHYSLPESLEEYVQEIGRAGRDGRLSYCHLLFDDATYFKLRSLMYSDGVDEYTVNRFLCHVFSNDTSSPGKICSLAKESVSRKFDMKEEVMLTILTRLELGEVQYLHLHPQMNVSCTLNFHKTPPALLAAKDIVVAAILKKSETKQGQYVFDIPTVANSIAVQAIDLSNQLQTLKLKGEITYELKDPAYCYTIVDFPKDLCSLTADLTKWLSEVESCKEHIVVIYLTSSRSKSYILDLEDDPQSRRVSKDKPVGTQVQKMDAMYNAASFAVKACDKSLGCSVDQHTPCLQRKISEYFDANDDSNVSNKMGQSSPFLRADIKVFLQSNSYAKFTPRAVARIMHGIASPAFPSATWSRTHFWGRYMQIDFKLIMEAAKAELMNFVGTGVL